MSTIPANLIHENDTVRYAVKVNGKIVSQSYLLSSQAQDAIKMLNEEHQAVAEIVQVTVDGKEILFG